MIENQTNSAIVNYGLAMALAAIFGNLSYFSLGDSAGLVALKTIVAPFYLLANRAVPTFFREPLVEPRWTGRAIKSHLLTAAIFAGFMTLFLWNPDQTADMVISQFALMMAFMGVSQLTVLALHIQSQRKGKI